MLWPQLARPISAARSAASPLLTWPAASQWQTISFARQQQLTNKQQACCCCCWLFSLGVRSFAVTLWAIIAHDRYCFASSSVAAAAASVVVQLKLKLRDLNELKASASVAQRNSEPLTGTTMRRPSFCLLRPLLVFQRLRARPDNKLKLLSIRAIKPRCC